MFSFEIINARKTFFWRLLGKNKHHCHKKVIMEVVKGTADSLKIVAPYTAKNSTIVTGGNSAQYITQVIIITGIRINHVCFVYHCFICSSKTSAQHILVHTAIYCSNHKLQHCYKYNIYHCFLYRRVPTHNKKYKSKNAFTQVLDYGVAFQHNKDACGC